MKGRGSEGGRNIACSSEVYGGIVWGEGKVWERGKWCRRRSREGMLVREGVDAENDSTIQYDT